MQQNSTDPSQMVIEAECDAEFGGETCVGTSQRIEENYVRMNTSR